MYPSYAFLRRLARCGLIGLLVLPSMLRGQGLSPTLAAEDRKAIVGVLMEQQRAWNRGDIEAFMRGYWPSDSLTFVGGRGVTYGWQATQDGYYRRYPDRAAMGRLTFEVVRLTALGPRTALLIGRWRLQRADDQPGGYFSLIWRRIEGRWLIVSDHTSSE